MRLPLFFGHARSGCPTHPGSGPCRGLLSQVGLLRQRVGTIRAKAIARAMCSWALSGYVSGGVPAIRHRASVSVWLTTCRTASGFTSTADMGTKLNSVSSTRIRPVPSSAVLLTPSAKKPLSVPCALGHSDIGTERIARRRQDRPPADDTSVSTHDQA